MPHAVNESVCAALGGTCLVRWKIRVLLFPAQSSSVSSSSPPSISIAAGISSVSSSDGCPGVSAVGSTASILCDRVAVLVVLVAGFVCGFGVAARLFGLDCDDDDVAAAALLRFWVVAGCLDLAVTATVLGGFAGAAYCVW